VVDTAVGGTLLKSRALTLLEAEDLRKALHRTLDVFADAAELDRSPNSQTAWRCCSRKRAQIVTLPVGAACSPL
jgi:hypothetical protein